jgi:uncharacterized protein (DUF488 family)
MDHFLSLLKQHQVNRVVDVRSTPYSKWQPQYNREGLAAALRRNDIDYEFMGTEFGARSDDRSCYENGKVVYSRLAAAAGFQSAVQKLSSDCMNVRIALMCAEQEPLECHRTILVARSLELAGLRVMHIHPDGRIEAHSDTMLRLLKLLKMPEVDLFHTTEEIIEDAYERQEQRIAYVDRDNGSREPALGAFA